MLDDVKKSFLTPLMIKWFAMIASLFLYLFICYMFQVTGTLKPLYTAEILQKNLFNGMTIHAAIYLASAIIFIVGDLLFKASYKRLVIETVNKKFKNKEEELTFFTPKYTSLMFRHIAIFNTISIIGVVVFFMTLDFATLVNLIIVALLGMTLVMPNKVKFEFQLDTTNQAKK